MRSLSALLILAAPLAAQNRFRAEMDGGQVVPAVVTASGGWAAFHLNADSSLDYRVANWGAGGFGAALHRGASGAEGPPIAALAPGPNSWNGTTAPLSAADAAALRAGEVYLEIRTAAFPEGEIRGQLCAAPRAFAAHLDGAQVTIVNPVPDVGAGRFTVNLDHTLTYRVESSTYAGISAHIHFGPPGVNGAIVFPLQGGPHLWSGTTRALTADEFALLQDGDYYVNVHGSITPGEEIRGQILRAAEPYGRPCAAGPRLALDGAPMRGAPLVLQIASGPPGGRGILAVSPQAAAVLSSGCPLLIAGPFLALLPLRLDAAGALNLPFRAPDFPGSQSLFLQFAGPGFTSNGLQVDLIAF